MYIFRNILIYYILFISIYTFSTSCSDDEKDPIKFKIICSGTFYGSYSINGGDAIFFSNEEIEQLGTNNYQFEREIEDVDYLTIEVTRDDRTDSLKIIIIRDDEVVKESFLDAVDSDVVDYNMDLDILYNFGEEDE